MHFFRKREIPTLWWKRFWPFISQKETQGECKIRRLTGSLRIAEYIFGFANFCPFFGHLFRIPVTIANGHPENGRDFR